MKLIGLVGGIASGKSFVAKVLSELGAKVIDADQLAHQVLSTPEVISMVANRFGTKVLDDDGKLVRSELAKVVFEANAESQRQLDWLESVLHPRIHQQVRPLLDLWRKEGQKAAVLDAPVLIKAGWHLECDEILFVDCDLAVRQTRAKKRGWDQLELQRRESHQTPLAEKLSLATFVVHNDISELETRNQLETFWQQRVLQPAS